MIGSWKLAGTAGAPTDGTGSAKLGIADTVGGVVAGVAPDDVGMGLDVAAVGSGVALVVIDGSPVADGILTTGGFAVLDVTVFLDERERFMRHLLG
jgi:hypothetical protein